MKNLKKVFIMTINDQIVNVLFQVSYMSYYKFNLKTHNLYTSCYENEINTVSKISAIVKTEKSNTN